MLEGSKISCLLSYGPSTRSRLKIRPAIATRSATTAMLAAIHGRVFVDFRSLSPVRHWSSRQSFAASRFAAPNGPASSIRSSIELLVRPSATRAGPAARHRRFQSPITFSGISTPKRPLDPATLPVAGGPLHSVYFTASGLQLISISESNAVAHQSTIRPIAASNPDVPTNRRTFGPSRPALLDMFDRFRPG